jgi:hypothetical protein
MLSEEESISLVSIIHIHPDLFFPIFTFKNESEMLE